MPFYVYKTSRVILKKQRRRGLLAEYLQQNEKGHELYFPAKMQKVRGKGILFSSNKV